MKTDGVRIVGVLTACLLGAGLSAPLSVQAQADHPRTQALAAASTAKVTASTAVPSKSVKEIAPTADGRFLVAVQGNRVVRYRTTPSKISEVGRSRNFDRLKRVQALVVHPNGKFAYAAVTPKKSNARKHALLVFRVDRLRVKLVKQVGLRSSYPDKRVVAHDLVMRPDGKRIYLSVRRDLLTFSTGSGKSVDLVSVEKGQRVTWRDMAVTPDGTKLITGVRGDRIKFVRYRLWDISGSGAVPGEEKRIDISRFDFTDPASLVRVVPAPNSTVAHVQVVMFVDYAEYEITKVRLSDGKVLASLGGRYGPVTTEEILGRSPSGKRIYIADRGKANEDRYRKRILARSNKRLSTYQRLWPTRLALEDVFAISPAGKTKGLIYTVQKASGHDRLVSVRD